MSIIIVGVFADHVLIATDTFCVQHGPYSFVSKACQPRSGYNRPAPEVWPGPGTGSVANKA